MLSIGEFARLVGVSQRMLRHYDGLGLLVPERVDEYSGYRYYSTAQLDRANRLVALKDLGFRLEEVGEMLDEDASSPRIAGLLRGRRAELRERLPCGGDLASYLVIVVKPQVTGIVAVHREHRVGVFQ